MKEKFLPFSELENRREYIISNVPFFQQEITKENYSKNGFDSYEEAKHWERRSCGAVCLKMVINSFYPDLNVSTKELIARGLEKNAYKEKIGWIHQGLVELGEEYGLVGGRESIGENIEKIKDHLIDKKLVVASVAYGLKVGRKYTKSDGSVRITRRGGHLVVIYGVTERNNKVEKLFLHHTSPQNSYEWANFEINRAEFLECFSEAGNIIFFVC
ncbi:MAG: C39 family peptidase [Candidatus Moraniibacteriota bacterium]